MRRATPRLSACMWMVLCGWRKRCRVSPCPALDALNHNYQVDWIGRAHLLRIPHGFSTRRDVLHPELASLIQERAQINPWYVQWARTQTADSLNERLAFDFVSGKSTEMRRGAMFLHIVNHKTYHRGWGAQMFFDQQVAPPETDLCIYLTETERLALRR